MNFKKFHESRNLFDESTLQNGYYGGGDDDYTSYRPDDKYRAFAMNLVAGTYTLRIYCDVSIKLLRVSNSIDGRVTVATDDQPYTFTLAGDATIYVSFRNQTTTNNFPNLKVMLNTGSTALPYEPYSSEVWHDTPHYIHNTSTDTITTPVDIYVNDTTATVGLKGNMEESGTPTPTNPVHPQECGERTGNSVNVSSSNCIVYSNYNQFVIDGQSIDVSGNALFGFIVKCNSNAEYTVSCIRTGYNVDMRIREYSDLPTDWTTDFITQSVNQSTAAGNSATFTTTATTKYLLVCFYGSSIARISNIMLNLGSEALPYEPWGIKIPILSANTTTPVYLGEVQSTRRIKKLVLTGEENINYYAVTQGSLFRMVTTDGTIGQQIYNNALCTHYVVTTVAERADNTLSGNASASNTNLDFIDNRYNSVADFKAYLQQQYAAGTPICVWYVLATPTTDIVNEPLRKIGDYADEVSGITIPTIAGANTLSIGTTLQPSEVSVNYKGWHPITDVHEAENGQWD